MVKIGNMVWRIGRLLDVRRQIAWTRAAGFDGIGLHASAGAPGQWRGLEPTTCDAAARSHFRQDLADFAFVEIHAPFAIELREDTLAGSLVALEPVFGLARDLGAAVVTVHAQLAGARPAPWLPAMRKLNARAAQARTVVALEIVAGFESVAAWNLPRVGINLDVGHMYLPAHRHLLDGYGGITGLIPALAPHLLHLHLHDVAGPQDHLEIGTGEIPYDEVAAALRGIGYAGTATIEPNPDRVSPAGMRRNLKTLRRLMSA